MAKKTSDSSSALKFKQPDYIIASVYAGTEASGAAPTGDVWYLEQVVRDTTSITQDDPETTDIECETSDSPIDTVTKLGKFQFSAECADTQEGLVQGLMGWEKDGTKVIAPASYVEKFVKVDVVFKAKDYTAETPKYIAFTIPRLKLNSKIMLESMNSNIARVNLAGTAYDWKLSTDADAKATPFYMDTNYTLPA